MMRRILLFCCVTMLALAALIPVASVRAQAAAPAFPAFPAIHANHLAPSDLPEVDPEYIYNQLFYMATHFQHREAGYDTSLPPLTNGHDEFAAYWAGEMQKDLAGFGAEVTRDPFTIAGWPGRSAVVPAVNVEVTVPGLAQPDQVVIIGCHYDGEAVSTQSANDDASGCAIELGVAKAMGAYWRAHAVYPARTLRFVLYDAEEQGIFGSFHAVNATVNGDLGNIVAMFNEEQSGISYPLRFLGNAANPLLPMFTLVSPYQSNAAYPNQGALSPQQRTAIATFHGLLAQAIPAVFAEFHSLGYTSLAYHDTNGQPVNQPIFTPDQAANGQLLDDSGAGSDQIPFTLAGIPCATFLGNSTYYDRGTPPPWSYPYDQPQDTIQLMNTYANDTAEEAPALTLSLALPGMLTTWMLAQPQILGAAADDGKPIAAISDIGPTPPGKTLAFDARAAYDPAGSSRLSYSWSFGDGAAATGVSVTHTYAAPGTYTLALTVSSPTGSRRITKTLAVTESPPVIVNPYASYHPTGSPRVNPNVTLPKPNQALGQVPPPQPSHPGGTSPSDAMRGVQIAVLLIALVLLLGGGSAFFLLGRRRAAPATRPSSGAGDSIDIDRQRRIEALRALANSPAPPPASTPDEPPTPPEHPPPAP